MVNIRIYFINFWRANHLIEQFKLFFSTKKKLSTISLLLWYKPQSCTALCYFLRTINLCIDLFSCYYCSLHFFLMEGDNFFFKLLIKMPTAHKYIFSMIFLCEQIYGTNYMSYHGFSDDYIKLIRK